MFFTHFEKVVRLEDGELPGVPVNAVEFVLADLVGAQRQRGAGPEQAPPDLDRPSLPGEPLVKRIRLDETCLEGNIGDVEAAHPARAAPKHLAEHEVRSQAVKKRTAAELHQPDRDICPGVARLAKAGHPSRAYRRVRVGKGDDFAPRVSDAEGLQSVVTRLRRVENPGPRGLR